VGLGEAAIIGSVTGERKGKITVRP